MNNLAVNSGTGRKNRRAACRSPLLSWRGPWTPASAVLILMAAVPPPCRADEAGRTWAAQAALPISINAWVDYRLADQSYRWAGRAGTEDLNDAYVRYGGVGFNVRVNGHMQAYVLFLFEEFFADPDHDRLNVDEVWVRLNYDGLFLKAGKFYAPFAHETTFGVEEPLTWYFGDCRKSGLEAGYENRYAVVSATVFNGDFDPVDRKGRPRDERIDDYVLHIHIHPLADLPEDGLEIGAGYISDVTEAQINLVRPFLSGFYRDPVPAASYYASFSVPISQRLRLAADGEYIRSERFAARNYTDRDGDRTYVSAANAELALADERGWRVGIQYAMMGGLDWLGAASRDPALRPEWFESMGGYAGAALDQGLAVAAQVIRGRDDQGDRVTETYLQVLFKF